MGFFSRTCGKAYYVYYKWTTELHYCQGNHKRKDCPKRDVDMTRSSGTSSRSTEALFY